MLQENQIHTNASVMKMWDKAGAGMGRERKTRKAQYLHCSWETAPLKKKLYPDYLRQSVEPVWDKVPICTNVP